MTQDALEIGGDFDWSGIPPGPYLRWPDNSIWYGRGRDALTAIFHARKAEFGDGVRLLLPDYFCPSVANFWQRSGISLVYYRDDPSLPHPVWESIDSQGPGLLLAVNYFGVRDMRPWRERYGPRDDLLLIEDQTHDPFCPDSDTGAADYAFASVRKLLPVSDGAILWSPAGARLPSAERDTTVAGASAKLAAMVLKASYLGQCPRDPSLKERFRQLQLTGEQELESFPGILSVTPWSVAALEHGYPKAWRDRRERNVRFIVDELIASNVVQPLFSDWMPGQCPYNAVVLYPRKSARDAARNRLIAAGIYPPVHWPVSAEVSTEAHELGCRVLTIPLDHRCGEGERAKILAHLR